jgi:low affinity Fe/Cu permease
MKFEKKKKEFYIHSFEVSISTLFIFLVSFFYCAPLLYDLPLVWQILLNIAVSILGLYSTYEREHVA